MRIIVFTGHTVGSKHADSIPFSDKPECVGDGLKRVTFFVEEYVHGMQVAFRQGGEQPLRAHPNAIAAAQARSTVITLEDDERVERVRGRCGMYIDSVELVTSRAVHRCWSRSGGGDAFEFTTAPNFHVVGFEGAYGGHLHQLGVVVDRVRDVKSWFHRLPRDHLIRQQVRELLLLRVHTEPGNAVFGLALLPLLEIVDLLVSAEFPPCQVAVQKSAAVEEQLQMRPRRRCY
jgi:hypothetical protein